MIPSTTPYVKVLIWESHSEEEKMPSQNYGHVALETCTGSTDPTYMSFWACGHPETCGALPHFHHTKEEDDREEAGKAARSYFLSCLDIAKINAAFEAFKAKPDAWGALGWGLFGRAYARDCRGLTVFLLEKGGIFNHPQVDASYRLNSIAKKAFYGFGSLYSAVNLWFSHYVNYYNRPFVIATEKYSDYISVYPSLDSNAKNIWAYAVFLGQVSMGIDSSQQSNVGVHQRAFSEHTIKALENCEKLREDWAVMDKSNSLIEKNFAEIQEHIALFEKIGRQLKWISIISGVSLFVLNYINNRFIASRYSPRDIRVLLEKAAK